MSGDKLNSREKDLLGRAFTEHYAYFVSVAKKIVGNEEAAEEVVSKTMSYICRRITKKDQPEIRLDDCRAYICCAIRSRAINYLRDNKRVDHLEDLVVPYEDLLQDYRSHE